METEKMSLIIASLFAGIGLIMAVLSILAHILVPKLLKHPGLLIFEFIICQIFFYSHWFFTFPHKTEGLPTSGCYYIALITIFFYYVGLVCILFLCLEIYIILKYKAYSTSKLRMVIYNLSSVVISSILVVIHNSLDSLGPSELGSCLIKKDTVGEKLDFSLNMLFMLLLIFSYYKIRKQLGCCYGPALHQLSKVILVACITNLMSRVTITVIYIQREDHSHVSTGTFVIATLSSIYWGSSVSTSRMLHPKVVAQLKAYFGFQISIENSSLIEHKEINEEVLKSIMSITLESASDDIADFIEHLGHKIIMQSLILLTLRFRDYEELCENLSTLLENYKGRPETIHYSELTYKKLASRLAMPFIEQIYCPDVSLIEFEAGLFRCIMKSSGFDKHQLLESLLSYENLRSLASISNKGGSSNSFFYSSTNQKIVIKTITPEERESFLKVLPIYTKRVVENPYSKLVRIFGLFQILPHQQDFIIMENAIPYKDTCVLFDLKGSTVDRHVTGVDSENPPNGFVLKDVNFKRYNKNIIVKNRDEVIKVLTEDFKILKSCKLMDYSMLVGIYTEKDINTRYSIDNKYSIAIIDFFQRYNYKKSLEHTWKRYILRKSEGISAISPKLYYKRIKSYIKSIILE